jgi:mannitol/fructose-specific phosphotransferase system IIA component
MSDSDKIRDVVGCGVVMSELGVKFEDRAFMMLLADIANDAKHFIDMLRRLSSHFEQPCDSGRVSFLRASEDETKTILEDRLCT